MEGGTFKTSTTERAKTNKCFGQVAKANREENVIIMRPHRLWLVGWALEATGGPDFT